MLVFFTKEATKHYTLLKQSDQNKIAKKLFLLKGNPLLGKKLSGELFRIRSLKAWPYRIIYYIDTLKQEVWVTSILHRQGAYK